MEADLRIDFQTVLTEGRLIKRYKRFLADVELADGRVVTAHCVNTGRMTGCSTVGNSVWLEPAPKGSKRKLEWTWVLSRVDGGHISGVHTGYPNQLVAGALEGQEIGPLRGYTQTRREVKMSDKSRVDVLLQAHANQPDCWVEVKNVTLVEDGAARFPDAVTQRGLKHLNELILKVKEGERAAMVYVVQRPDANRVEPADHIDPAYGKALRNAIKLGVEAYAIRVIATPSFLETGELMPVRVP
jgi:sugar fermentation stimulation protein A